MNQTDLIEIETDAPTPTSTNGLTCSIVSMDEEMIPDVAVLHRQVFSQYMNARLGRGYIKAFLRWFCSANRAVALVAVDHNGRIVGYVVGAPVGYGKKMNRDLSWVALVAMVLRPWLLGNTQFRKKAITRLRILLGLSQGSHPEPDLPTPTLSLVSIAVSPSAQRQHVGKRLMEEFEQRGCQVDMRSARLSVYPDNRGARGLYERCGWQSVPGPTRDTGEMYYFRVFVKQMGGTTESTISMLSTL